MFPVWLRSEALAPKEVVLGLKLGTATKAYQIAALNEARVINDTVGGADVVVVASASSEAARVYERASGQLFALTQDASSQLPTALVDETGSRWTVTESALVSETGEKLPRVSTHQSFWFGWFQFHPETELFSLLGP